MNSHHVLVAVEDDLSEAVVRKLLHAAAPDVLVAQVVGKKGSGYLRSRIAAFNKTAHGVPFVVLTDLDNETCAPTLVKSWLRERLAPMLCLRVAVREVEAWLLADRERFAQFLAVSSKFIPEMAEDDPDPKALVVRLARHSRRRAVRDGVAPRDTSTARQGPSYNLRMIEFVQNAWDVDCAAKRAPSLERALRGLRKLRARIVSSSNPNDS